MRKKCNNPLILANSIFREVLLQYPQLFPIVEALRVKGPYGNQTVRQVCKLNNIHESVVLLVFEACVSNEIPIIDSLPSYGLLQLCELTLVVCDTLSQQLERQKSTFSTSFLHQVELEHSMLQILDVVQKHREELSERMVPHTYKIYELYYSPEYTSRKRDLLNYSIEFFPTVALPSVLMNSMEVALEKYVGWQEMQAFHRLTAHIKIIERLEMYLIRPVVLQMENDILTSIQKKNSKPVRVTYLNFKEELLSQQVLSPRELEVLKLVAVGLLNKEIAVQLGISLSTVISHRKHIVAKLGINTLAGLAVYAYTHGYLNDSIFSEEEQSAP